MRAFAVPVIYVSRFVGDLVSILIGAISAVPLALGYIPHAPQWLTADIVKWGALALGCVIVSYRIWRRAEWARTVDAFQVLIFDAESIERDLKDILDSYEWPPQHTDCGKTFTQLRPLRDRQADAPGLNEKLGDVAFRFRKHGELVRKTANLHGIKAKTLDPDELSANTILPDVEDYIRSLADAAKPPKTWLERLSTLRCPR